VLPVAIKQSVQEYWQPLRLQVELAHGFLVVTVSQQAVEVIAQESVYQPWVVLVVHAQESVYQPWVVLVVQG
jgi:hypothetical protein